MPDSRSPGPGWVYKTYGGPHGDVYRWERDPSYKASSATSAATTSPPVTAKAAAKKTSVSSAAPTTAAATKKTSVSSAAPTSSGTTSMARTTSSPSSSAAKTSSSYVDLSPDLAAAWSLIEAANQGKDVNTLFAGQGEGTGLSPAEQAKYWQDRGATSKEAFGQAHAAEDMALKLGTYKQSGTDYKLGSDKWKEAFTSRPGQYGSALNYPGPQSTAQAPLTRWEMFNPQVPPFSGGSGSSAASAASAAPAASAASAAAAPKGPVWSDPTSSVYASPEVQMMDLATLTDDMDLTNKLEEVINMDSPLFKAAATKALQAMQKRGIVNSSLANEAVMRAILDVALPVAQAEVQALQQNLYYNTDWNNQQKTEANKYFYERMMTKLKGSLDEQLNKMVQSFGAWGQYGQWIQNIITSPGADEDAWKRMLDAMQGAGGWPKYPGL